MSTIRTGQSTMCWGELGRVLFLVVTHRECSAQYVPFLFLIHTALHSTSQYVLLEALCFPCLRF